MVCSHCGKDVPGEFAFCPFCGTPLTAQPAAAAVEERKVVSVLFCDLVGFTAASERADPEDVRARLRPYHDHVRGVLERHGGTVEKFVGDAVMAVFGAPVAHEDDAERAVRAGLRILETLEELNDGSLQVRVGISTGEVVVVLGARPERGEGMVLGDVVNTASRLQGIAPVNGIAVSTQTYRATERIFDWEPLPPVTVKGKSEPLTAYRPLRPRARFGSDVSQAPTTPLVGRELEKPLLIGTFERAAQQLSCQLVTIVGEPGVGKSRLCTELLGYLEQRPGLVRWRQGRCLPYGEGIAFWALGEIVKAECGILESDSPETAAAKLERSLPESGDDRTWLLSRLAPLVGAPAEPASQAESFTAWRRFVELLTVTGPAVLVFEDLHWADPALLEFIAHLADWAEGVPLLLLCTARPELYERHPTWATGLRNATAINLPPLTVEETSRLIAALLERAVLSADTQAALLERAGGNPLYAEEFVRLLTDRGDISEKADVPDSVQSLIAARLDTLPAERKSLLQDAAVIGKVFWAGALAEMGNRDVSEVEQALHELSRKELVRPARTSSMQGEAEYGFWHLLVRDVCYQQIPRAARSARHEAAAAWVEKKAGDRVEDLADVLAYHYQAARELAHAAGQTADLERLNVQAIRFHALAGERALALDVARAEEQLSKALELCDDTHPERASLLEKWANAAQQQGRLHEARQALAEALNLHRRRDDIVGAGRTLTTLSLVLNRLGDASYEQTIEEAVELLESRGPGRELVDAYARLASLRAIASSNHAEGIAAAERAIALAESLGLPDPPVALGTRGVARAYAGEREGLDDLRRTAELAVELGQGRTAAVAYCNLAIATAQYERAEVALAVCQEGIEFSERRSHAEAALQITCESLRLRVALGQPDEALAGAIPVADRYEAAGNINIIEPRSLQLRLLAERGTPESAPSSDELVTRARESGEPQMIATAFAAAARILLAQGERERARALLVELEQVPHVEADPSFVSVLPELVRTSLALDEREVAALLVARAGPTTPFAEHARHACRAQLAEAAGEHRQAVRLYAEAAERWLEFGNVPERAYAVLGQGRCLGSLGDPDADRLLRDARGLFVSLGYRPAVAQAESLLEQGLAV